MAGLRCELLGMFIIFQLYFFHVINIYYIFLLFYFNNFFFIFLLGIGKKFAITKVKGQICNPNFVGEREEGKKNS